MFSVLLLRKKGIELNKLRYYSRFLFSFLEKFSTSTKWYFVKIVEEFFKLGITQFGKFRHISGPAVAFFQTLCSLSL